MKPTLLIALLLAGCCCYCPAQVAGTLDTTFGTGGHTFLKDLNQNLMLEQIKTDANGKIVVLYNQNVYLAQFNGSYLSRFNTDGSIDTDFGTGGTFSLVAENVHARHFDIAANGRIVVFGETPTGNNTNDMELLVFQPNGQLDGTFSGDGRMVFPTTDMPYENGGGVLIQPDGKIVYTHWYYSISSANHNGILIGRVDSAGNYDYSFGVLSQRSFEVPGMNITPHSLYRRTDGKYLIMGAIDSLAHADGDETFMALFNDSNIDNSFGDTGWVMSSTANAYNANWKAGAVKILSDERMVSSMLKQTGIGPIAVMANLYSSAGSPVADITLPHVAIHAFAEQTTGKIIAAGGHFGLLEKGIRVQRLTAQGLPDTDFGTGGAYVDTSQYQATLYSVAIQPNNDIILGCVVLDSLNDKMYIKLTRLTGTTVPTITLAAANTTFTTAPGTPSQPQIVTLSCINISADAVITAPAGFEVSTTTTGFAQQTTIAQSLLGNGQTASFYLRFNPAQAGVYNGNVTATAGNVTGTLPVNGSTPTGITETTNIPLLLYPNPTDNTLYTQLPYPADVAIRNVTGQVLLQHTNAPAGILTTGVEALAPGSYLFTITGKQGTLTKPFIKQ
jgi:uncharacterized delta-60 repeat protein